MDTRYRNALTDAYTPSWTWRAVALAALATVLLYGALPFLERLSVPPDDKIQHRPVDTVVAPPPPPTPPVERLEEARRPVRPEPQLEEVRRLLTPLQAGMNLQMVFGDLGGDFAVDFGVQALAGEVQALIYEIGDLDEPPRPLVQLRPMYPPQARLRQVSGYVTVEFVVETDGAVRDIVVTAAEPPDVFDRAAVRAVERWRFTPGLKAGEPVPVRVRQRVEFQLQ